jgi:hypothetical protein
MAALGLQGCSSAAKPAVEPARPDFEWRTEWAENLVWQPDDGRFAQGFAVETSGLADSGRLLYASSEKYARVLVMDPADDLRTRVVDIAVPRHSELEGIAWHDGSLYLCDEAHAAVYVTVVGDETRLVDKSVPVALVATQLAVEGVELEGDKIGVEGIEVTPDGRFLHLLLERSGNDESGCVSRIWRLRIESDRLVADGAPVDISLEDCAWRLTGLAWMGRRLLGLKTQYPGERYQIVEIDPTTGGATVVQDLTDYLRAVRSEGWGNNVEGIAVDREGALWLVGDNAVTGVIDDPYPPETDERALLVRIPKRIPKRTE